jgi:hypothetical protein
MKKVSTQRGEMVGGWGVTGKKKKLTQPLQCKSARLARKDEGPSSPPPPEPDPLLNPSLVAGPPVHNTVASLPPFTDV